MANFNENYFFNSMLAKALIQLCPAYEKKILLKWFDKLHTMNTTTEELEMRNEYVWFILMMLQCKKIKEPFDKLPPKTLIPLRDMVERSDYEDVLVSNEDGVICKKKLKMEGSKDEENPSSAPAKFLENQPFPQQGVVCYIAAFSDQTI